jgi:ferredoxin-type protein NapH
MNKYKYLILRRISQISILMLYFVGNFWGFQVLVGNLSTSIFMTKIPLSDPFAVLQILATGTLVTFDLLLGAGIIILFYGIFGGRAFCSWVCPINMVTDLANWIRRKLKIDKIENKKIWLSRKIRFYLIPLALLVSTFMGVAAFEFISPISIFTRGVIFGFGMGFGFIISIFLFDLFIVKNGWCGHICPLGAFYSIIGKWSIFKIQHIQENCTLCMKCKDVCPEKDVLFMIGKNSESVLSKECTLCGRCIEVCDDKALNFHIRNFRR